MSRLADAIDWASELHAGQTRADGTTPYLAHLLNVVATVLADGGDEEEAIAAALHDAVEDGGGEPLLAEIRKRFGERVARIVEALTDTPGEWEQRKRAYLAHLEEAPEDELRVGMADKLDNARTCLLYWREEGPEKWASGRGRAADDQLWYFRALVDVFGRRRPGRHTEELRRVVSELERLAGYR